MVDRSENTRMQTPDVDIARATQVLNAAQWAGSRYARMDAETVHRVCAAIADAGYAKAREYAEWAVRETGYGRVDHKVVKNEGCSKGVFERYGGLDFFSPRINEEKKFVELPRPAGVIFALTPVTNPVATVYFKVLLAAMTRNAIVLSPHPGANDVCCDAIRHLADAAIRAGAPTGLIQVVEEPTLGLIDAYMTHDLVDLIVATGGPAVVKAAYRSGHPAIGVGSGNAPVFVDQTCDLKRAARYIVESKGFDNSVLCSNESTIIAVEGVADKLLSEMKLAKAHICSPPEVEALRRLLFVDNSFNTAMIGKDASHVAEAAGFTARNAEILVAPIDLIQPEEPLVREKLTPVLAFGRVAGLEEGLSAARSVMRHAGKGHSAVIHSTDEKSILAYADAIPALRVCVNVGCSLGAAGFETHLGPSMTIGTGFAGGSSVGDNLKPENFINFARIAYNASDAEIFGNFEGLSRRTIAPMRAAASGDVLRFGADETERMRRELRLIVQQELKSLLAA